MTVLVHIAPPYSTFIPAQKRKSTTGNTNIINGESKNLNQESITKEFTFKDLKNYFYLTVTRTSILSKIGILRNIKELKRHFKR